MELSSADTEDNSLEGKASAWIEGTVPALGAVLHGATSRVCGVCAEKGPAGSRPTAQGTRMQIRAQPPKAHKC